MIQAALLVGLTPLVYWAWGYVIWRLARAGEARVPLIPLLGAAAAGWFSEVVFFAGLPVATTVGIATVVAVAFMISQRSDWRRDRELILRFTFLYLLMALAVASQPFPAIGHWSGDWFENVSMGRALLSGVYRPELLLRTPFFAAVSFPLQAFFPELPSYQAMSALVSAAAVFSFLYARPAPAFRWLILVCLTPFALLHVATVWPKMFPAGLIVAAVLEAMRVRDGDERAWIWSSVFLGCAMAGHHSSLIYAPLLLLVAGVRFGRLVVMGVAAVLTVGMFEIWSVLHFGLKARIESNPTLLHRENHSLAGYWDISSQIVWATFVGRFPLGVWNAWLDRPADAGTLWALGRVYFTISAWVTTQAATFLFGYLPFFIFCGKKLVREVRPSWAVAAVLVAIVGAHAVLNMHVSLWGATQTGLTPLCLLLYLWIARKLGRRPPEFAKIAAFTVILGTIPFFAFELGALLALHSPYADVVWSQLMLGDSDAEIYTRAGLVSWGQLGFPTALVLIVVGIAFLRKRLFPLTIR